MKFTNVIRTALGLLVAATLYVPAISPARDSNSDSGQYTSPYSSSQPNEGDLKEHKHYTNKYGEEVHSPAHSVSGAVPNGATAQCNDGTYSFSKSRSGTCSHHGGVASWL